MPVVKAPMALTAELVARVERIEPDPGLRPGMVHLSDADYDALVKGLFERHRPSELWVFGYGSLIWKPEFSSVEHRRATAYGWHRSFCMKLERFRGTPEQPGLMMALDRGGCCHGVAYRLPDENHADQLGRLVRREMSIKRSTNVPRWLTVDTELGKLRALAFTASPAGMTYGGKLPAEEVARILARAAGHWGSGASYLFQTITKLEEFGIHDTNLWRLQELVADEILEMTKPPNEVVPG
jgi:cation transport protein ChaC